MCLEWRHRPASTLGVSWSTRKVLEERSETHGGPAMNRSVTRLFPVRLGVWTSTALTCAVLLIASAPTARAGVNVWTTHGPYGASVSALAIDSTTPTTLSAGTGAGVYKSTNGGSSWSAVNTGLSGDAFYVAARACRYVGSVAASPSAATRRGPPRAGIRKRSPASPRERGRGRCSAPPADPSHARGLRWRD